MPLEIVVEAHCDLWRCSQWLRLNWATNKHEAREELREEGWYASRNRILCPDCAKEQPRTGVKP